MNQSSFGTQSQHQLSLAINGDREALGRLLMAHRSYLTVLARSQIHRQLQGKADASDIVQETCLAAHNQLPNFRGSTPSEFAGWLRGILANQLAQHVRHYWGTQRRDVRLEKSLAIELDQASGCFERGLVVKGDSPSQEVVRREAMLELADALESLPDDYRTVILLRNVDNMPFRDIAQLMQRSIDSVEKLWVRGLGKLKTRMDSIFPASDR